MQIFGSKKPSSATSATLLPPFLPPLNYMKIRLIDAKVAVVAVKSIVSLVRGYWVDKWIGFPNVIRMGCSNVIRIGCSNVIRIGCSNVTRIGYSNVIRIGYSNVIRIGHSVDR